MQERLLILIDYVCKIPYERVGPILGDYFVANKFMQIKQTQMLFLPLLKKLYSNKQK